MKTQRICLIVALFGLSPVTALAQRGIMGGRGAMAPGRGPGTIARDPGVYVPKYVNAVNLAIEHRQDLSLSDSQFVHFIAIKRTLDSMNAPLVRKLDSVRRVFKAGIPLFSTPTAARRDSLAEARSLIIETIGDLRDNITAAREKAYAVLSSTQMTKVQELEEKAETAALAENQRAERSAAGRSGGVFGRPPAG